MLGLALDLMWLSLAAIGMFGRQARPYVSTLFVMWMVQEVAQASGVGMAVELVMIAADLIACAVLYLIWRRRKDAWGAVAVLMFAPSLFMQALYWLAVIHGLRFDWPFFWGSAFIFTVQMVSLASPGGLRLGSAVVRRLRSWRTVHGGRFRRRHPNRAFAAHPARTQRPILAQGQDA